MSTKPYLIRMTWLLITFNALVACTPNIETQSPTLEPTTTVIPTLTSVAATYQGAVLPTPKPIDMEVVPPPAWLISGHKAVPATYGSYSISANLGGSIVQRFFDAVVPPKDDFATANLSVNQAVTIILGSGTLPLDAMQASVGKEFNGAFLATLEDLRPLNRIDAYHEGNLTIVLFEPIGNEEDQFLQVDIVVGDNEAGPFTGGATYFWRLIPVSEALAPTPNYDQTATAIVQAVVSTVQPKVHASLPSPDKNWRVETIIYDCVQVAEDGPNAYEQLKLIQASDGTETVIDTQLQYCGGVGAYGLGGLYWSPNSRYFYYTDAREGSPDGLCWYWERPIYRMDVLTQAKEFIGEGPLSPDKTKIATWRENDLVIWGLDEGELARIPAAVADAKRGPISWSPDSGSLVYLQTTSDCFPFGKSYVIRFDLPEHRQSLLLESKPISFVHVSWETPDQISLSDEQGNQWNYDLVNSKLEPVP